MIKKVIKKFVIECNGKFWGITTKDGIITNYGWIEITQRVIYYDNEESANNAMTAFEPNKKIIPVKITTIIEF